MKEGGAQGSQFESAVLPHLGAAYNFVRWLLQDDADAQDVVQESCVRALRYFDSLRGEDPLPWLLTIVRNTAMTWLNRNRRPQVAALEDDESLIDPAQQDPAQAMLLQVDIAALQRSLDELAPEFREVIVLRELEGLSYKEIAAIVGVSIGTVMSRLSRARNRLQQAAMTRSSKELDRGM